MIRQRNEQIAGDLSIKRKKVSRWRTRFVQKGGTGIEQDEAGRGRKLTYPLELRELIVEKTTRAAPPDATQWSRTSMGKAMDMSPSTIGRIWRENGLKPHLVKTFKISNDPKFAEKLEDVVGLYLNAPEHAIVLCCDEKSQVQALDRTQPGLPLKKGRATLPQSGFAAVSSIARKSWLRRWRDIWPFTTKLRRRLSGPPRPMTSS